MSSFIIIPFLLAMFLAINMGGSGTAPSFSAAYGARIIKRQFIPGLFGIMVFAGAILAGKEVTLTLGKGLLEQSFFTPQTTSIILLSTALSIFFANLIGIPQSTSQSTVLAISGAAVALHSLNTHKLFYEIIPTWFFLPLISFGIMFLTVKYIFPSLRIKPNNVDYKTLNTKKNNAYKIMVLIASSYVAFSIGANNVANAAGPIASLTVNQLGIENLQNLLPITLLSVLLVAPCFAIGSSLLGHKVTKTTGKDIMQISPFYATTISVLVATLLLIASISKGIPTSLVQLNSAAIMALSVHSKGLKSTMKNKTVILSFIVWLFAPVFAFLTSYVLILLIL